MSLKDPDPDVAGGCVIPVGGLFFLAGGLAALFGHGDMSGGHDIEVGAIFVIFGLLGVLAGWGYYASND